MSVLPVDVLRHICSFVDDRKTCRALEWVGRISPEIEEAVEDCFSRITEISLSFRPISHPMFDVEFDDSILAIMRNAERKMTVENGLCSFKCQPVCQQDVDDYRFVVERAKNVKKLSLDFTKWRVSSGLFSLEYPQESPITINSFFSILKGQNKLRELTIAVGFFENNLLQDQVWEREENIHLETASVVQNYCFLDTQMARFVEQYPNLRNLELIETPAVAFLPPPNPAIEPRGEVVCIPRYEDLELLQAISDLEHLKVFGLTRNAVRSHVDWQNRQVFLDLMREPSPGQILDPRKLFPLLKRDDPQNSVDHFEGVRAVVTSKFTLGRPLTHCTTEFPFAEKFPHCQQFTISVHIPEPNLSPTNILLHLLHCLTAVGKPGLTLDIDLVGNLFVENGQVFSAVDDREELRGIVEEYNNQPAPMVGAHQFPPEFNNWGIQSSTVMHPVNVEALLRGELVKNFWVITAKDNIEITINIKYHLSD